MLWFIEAASNLQWTIFTTENAFNDIVSFPFCFICWRICLLKPHKNAAKIRTDMSGDFAKFFGSWGEGWRRAQIPVKPWPSRASPLICPRQEYYSVQRLRASEGQLINVDCCQKSIHKRCSVATLLNYCTQNERLGQKKYITDFYLHKMLRNGLKSSMCECDLLVSDTSQVLFIVSFFLFVSFVLYWVRNSFRTTLRGYSRHVLQRQDKIFKWLDLVFCFNSLVRIYVHTTLIVAT